MKAKIRPEDQWRSDNAVKDVLSHVAKVQAAKLGQKTQQEILVERQAAVAKDVYETFIRMHKIQVTPMRFDDAVQHISNQYREHYKLWDKDSLLELICLMSGVLAAQSIQHELI